MVKGAWPEKNTLPMIVLKMCKKSKIKITVLLLFFFNCYVPLGMPDYL
jgi:hypothetical protein